mmetsp:Transcript_1807/g.4707  ORF Transcript_1807/g.4707 Transcript_1807/m.4707 type:complete len:230 (-) Transcript_1807:264-953(-)
MNATIKKHRLLRLFFSSFPSKVRAYARTDSDHYTTHRRTNVRPLRVRVVTVTSSGGGGIIILAACACMHAFVLRCTNVRKASFVSEHFGRTVSSSSSRVCWTHRRLCMCVCVGSRSGGGGAEERKTPRARLVVPPFLSQKKKRSCCHHHHHQQVVVVVVVEPLPCKTSEFSRNRIAAAVSPPEKKEPSISISISISIISSSFCSCSVVSVFSPSSAVAATVVTTLLVSL